MCRAAATALSKRHVDGSLPMEDYNIELEDQGGQQVKFGSETDQRFYYYCSIRVETTRNNFYVNEICFFVCLLHSAAMMGLMLHAKAKSLIETDLYVDALEVLAMAEVSCNFLLAGNQVFSLPCF